MKTIDVTVMLGALLVLMLCCSCGTFKASGGTTHTVEGEATIRVVVGVDVSVCDGLEPAAKLECIKALIDLATAVSKQSESESVGFSGI